MLSRFNCFKSDSLWPLGLPPARLLCPWDSPGKNAGVGCRALLQGIFLTQGSNPRFLLAGRFFITRATCGTPSCIWGFPIGSASNLPAVQEMEETQVQSLCWEAPLQKEMATHSHILAWSIPWTEEPGWLQSVASQRVGHDWVSSHTHSFFSNY